MTKTLNKWKYIIDKALLWQKPFPSFWEALINNIKSIIEKITRK